jgi:hypothetical protein
MSKLFAPPPPPRTHLGRYRILSPNAAVRVSPLVLGGMSIGDKWEWDRWQRNCLLRCSMPTTTLAVTSSIPQTTSDSFLYLFLAPLADASFTAKMKNQRSSLENGLKNVEFVTSLLSPPRYVSILRVAGLRQFVLTILSSTFSTRSTINVWTWVPRSAPTTLATVVNPSTSVSRPVYKCYARNTSISSTFTSGTTKLP